MSHIHYSSDVEHHFFMLALAGDLLEQTMGGKTRIVNQQINVQVELLALLIQLSGSAFDG
ncbi:hypothetical protein D3C73_1384160 [compost metagenome]